MKKMNIYTIGFLTAAVFVICGLLTSSRDCIIIGIGAFGSTWLQLVDTIVENKIHEKRRNREEL